MTTKQYLEIKKSKNREMKELMFVKFYFNFSTAGAKRWIANHSGKYIYFLWNNYRAEDNEN